MQSDSKNKTSDFIVFKIIYPLLGLVYIAINPISLFIFAFLISFIVYYLIFRNNIFRKKFLFVLAPIYLGILFTYSISPKIQCCEFELTHPNWTELKGQVSDFNISWKGGKSRKSTANISYHYIAGSQKFSRTAIGVIDRRSHSIFWASDNEIKDSNLKLRQEVTNYIKDRNFKIFHNPKTNESRLLIPLNFLLLSNSSGFSIIYGMLKIILFPFLLIMIFLSIKKVTKLN